MESQLQMYFQNQCPLVRFNDAFLVRQFKKDDESQEKWDVLVNFQSVGGDTQQMKFSIGSASKNGKATKAQRLLLIPQVGEDRKFDEEEYARTRQFLNKDFWKANVFYLSDADIFERFKKTVNFLKGRYEAVDLRRDIRLERAKTVDRYFNGGDPEDANVKSATEQPLLPGIGIETSNREHNSFKVNISFEVQSLGSKVKANKMYQTITLADQFRKQPQRRQGQGSIPRTQNTQRTSNHITKKSGGRPATGRVSAGSRRRK